MKTILFSISLSLLSLTLIAQGCLPEGITFTTQEQIDNFQTDYPGCTEIEGDVIIKGSSISNLYALNVITLIGGNLVIYDNTVLQSLSGLESLTSITGYCSIGKFILVSPGYSFWIGNPVLMNLSGLENLSSIGGGLEFWGNDSLTSFTGLESLTSIGEALYITHNDAMTSLEGLEGVSSIQDFLVVQLNDALETLTGLDNLTSIEGNFIINDNNSLTSLVALENLTSVNGNLRVINNDSLASLAGLENINPSSIVDLIIEDNPQLSECDIECICNYLSAPNGFTEIHDNALGCNTQEEVEEACAIVAINEVSFEDNIITSPNPFSTSTSIIYDLKQPSSVHLSVYNQLGQLVYKHSEDQQQGEQQLQWDAQGLAEGIYYYRLQVGDAIANGKIVKVR